TAEFGMEPLGRRQMRSCRCCARLRLKQALRERIPRASAAKTSARLMTAVAAGLRVARECNDIAGAVLGDVPPHQGAGVRTENPSRSSTRMPATVRFVRE